MKICLCGSNKFMKEFQDWNAILTLGGHVVYSICMVMTNDDQLKLPEWKRRLDLIHLKKISESDAIVVLNVGGYYGDSTEREIEWARMERKDVFWLENDKDRNGSPMVMGPSVWTLYNLFDGGIPISSIPEAAKYV